MNEPIWPGFSPATQKTDEPKPEASTQVEAGEFSGDGEVSFSVGGIGGNPFKIKTPRPTRPAVARTRKMSNANRKSSLKTVSDSVLQLYWGGNTHKVFVLEYGQHR